MNGKKEIRDFLPTWELLAQLAEECSELAQAALKLRRCLDDLNPTRTPYEQALANLHEEWADVLLTVRVLGMLDENLIYQIMQQKHQRWLDHLIEHNSKEE